MWNQRYWNRKKLYFLVVCLNLVVSIGIALISQSVSNKMGKTLSARQAHVYEINKEIRAIEKELKRARSTTYRNELLVIKLNLESERSNAQLERLNMATAQASFSASQSQHLLYTLAILGFSWTFYYGFMRIE